MHGLSCLGEEMALELGIYIYIRAAKFTYIIGRLLKHSLAQNKVHFTCINIYEMQNITMQDRLLTGKRIFRIGTFRLRPIILEELCYRILEYKSIY